MGLGRRYVGRRIWFGKETGLVKREGLGRDRVWRGTWFGGMRWVSAGKWFRGCIWFGEDGFVKWRSLWREMVWEMELGLVNGDVFGEGDGLGKKLGWGRETGWDMKMRGVFGVRWV